MIERMPNSDTGKPATRQADASSHAGQLAALQLLCRLDLDEALCTPVEGRPRLVLKLERVLERERLRGARRHWSYDLNRHIALKQVLDRLRSK